MGLKACPYFIAYTYLHLLAATVISAFAARYNVLEKLGINMQIWWVSILLLLAAIAILLIILSLTPGPLKYMMFFLFVIILGSSLRAIANELQRKDLLVDVLTTTSSIFLAMTAVGLYDKQNLLGFGPYLLAGLVGLVLARLGLNIVTVTGGSVDSVKGVDLIISISSSILFSIYLAYDTQMLKKMAADCQRPDYIQGALSLYLDIINLFANLGDASLEIFRA